MKPSKIVAGTEADKTNELLQALGSLIEKKQSRQKPPPPKRTQANGDSARESKVSTNTPTKQASTNKNAALEDSGNPNSKTAVPKSEPSSMQTNSKENGISVNSQSAQERVANEKPVKQTGRIDNGSRDGAKTQLRNSTNRHQTNGTKPNKDFPKTQKPLPIKASVNDKSQNQDHVDAASVPPEDPNIDLDANSEPLLKNGELESDRSLRFVSNPKKSSRDQLFNGISNVRIL